MFLKIPPWGFPHGSVIKKVKVKVTQSCPTLRPTRFLCPWDFPGQNTGVGCLSLLQGIFPTQESNQGLLHCRRCKNWPAMQEMQEMIPGWRRSPGVGIGYPLQCSYGKSHGQKTLVGCSPQGPERVEHG